MGKIKLATLSFIVGLIIASITISIYYKIFGVGVSNIEVLLELFIFTVSGILGMFGTWIAYKPTDLAS